MFDWNRRQSRPRSVAADIQAYMKGATFPPLQLSPFAPEMPPEGHKSQRNRLTVRLERYRRLGQMNRFKAVRLDAETRRFVERHAPHEPLDVEDVDPETGERVCLPCEGYDNPATSPLPLRCIDQLGVTWLESFPLRTVERLIHMIPEYDKAKSWTFSSGDYARDVDKSIFRYYIWRNSEPNTTTPGGVSSLIVAYQPPYILAPRDFEQFVQTKSIPSYNELSGPDQERLASAQKVWAKIWDICKENNCNHFVLTNYMQWAFGGFSQGWKHGFTSNILDAYPRTEADKRALSAASSNDDISRPPNVIEHLFHWVISSMGFADAYVFPSVPEPVKCYYVDNGVLTPKQSHFPQGVRPTFSVYSASVSDCNEECLEDGPGSPGVNFELETPRASPVPFVDENWVAHPNHSPAATLDKASYIAYWRKQYGTSSRRRHPGQFTPIPVDAPSPVMSDWSDDSVDTVMDGTNDIPQGTYNIDPPYVEDKYAVVGHFE